MDIQDSIRKSNIHIMEVPEGEKQGKKKKKKNQKTYIKKLQLNTSLTCERKQKSRFKKPREFQTSKCKGTHIKHNRNDNS